MNVTVPRTPTTSNVPSGARATEFGSNPDCDGSDEDADAGQVDGWRREERHATADRRPVRQAHDDAVDVAGDIDVHLAARWWTISRLNRKRPARAEPASDQRVPTRRDARGLEEAAGTK